MLSFNIDRDFSNVLDGLVLVDLRRSDPGLLTRYMGRAEILPFCTYHGLQANGESYSPSRPIAPSHYYPN